METTGIVEIDLAALARNYRLLARAAAPDAKPRKSTGRKRA